MSGGLFQKRVTNLGNFVLAVAEGAAGKALMACVSPHLISKITSEWRNVKDEKCSPGLSNAIAV